MTEQERAASAAEQPSLRMRSFFDTLSTDEAAAATDYSLAGSFPPSPASTITAAAAARATSRSTGVIKSTEAVATTDSAAATPLCGPELLLLPAAPVSWGVLPTHAARSKAAVAAFLLPDSGVRLLQLEEAYVCENCCAVRGPEDVLTEIESYYCPVCFDSLTLNEAIACSCRCTKCFDCPRCCASLSTLRKPLQLTSAAFSGEAAASAAPNAFIFAAAAAVAAPQRCESLMSLSPSEEEEAEEGEGESLRKACKADPTAVSSPSSNKNNSNSEMCRGVVEEGVDDREELVPPQLQRVGGGGGLKKEYEYYLGCPYCKWDSLALHVVRRSAALVPAAAILTERVGTLQQRYFHHVLDVLQESAHERERTRQLETRVKHKAVALLFAAAAARTRSPSLHSATASSETKMQHPPNSAATQSPADLRQAEAPAAALEVEPVAGKASAPWRVKDVEAMLLAREARLHYGNVWNTLYRKQLPQPPPVVSLQQLLSQEQLLQKEAKPDGLVSVMTDLLFSWQLQHREVQLQEHSKGCTGIGSNSGTAAAQQMTMEGSERRRRSSRVEDSDAAVGLQLLPTPTMESINSPQLLLDRGSQPDEPPVAVPSQMLHGLLYGVDSNTQATAPSRAAGKKAGAGSTRSVYSETGVGVVGSASASVNPPTAPGAEGETVASGAAVSTARLCSSDSLVLEEWWTTNRPTLEQQLRNPNAMVAAATSVSLLQPLRKKLLTRESKRCRMCEKYLVKAHVSPLAIPPFRVNAAAALLLPWISPHVVNNSINNSSPNHLGLDVAHVDCSVMNPTEGPLLLRFHFSHTKMPTPAPAGSASANIPQLLLPSACNTDAEGRSISEDMGSKTHSKTSGGKSKGDGGDQNSFSTDRDDVAATGRDIDGKKEGTKRLSQDNAAAAGETASRKVERDSLLSRLSSRNAAAVCHADSSTAVVTGWETVEILTPDFELLLDPYDEMLEDVVDLNGSSNRSTSSCGTSRKRSGEIPALLSKTGNTAELRLRVKAKQGVQQQQLGLCCITVDVVSRSDSNAIRVNYVLYLGRI